MEDHKAQRKSSRVGCQSDGYQNLQRPKDGGHSRGVQSKSCNKRPLVGLNVSAEDWLNEGQLQLCYDEQKHLLR
jgi:hypothetical protein